MKSGNSDALVMWCTEGNEHYMDIQGLLLIRQILPQYRDAEPPKPVFYAPVDSADTSALCKYQPTGITLMAQGEGIQDANWQLEKIRALAEGQRLKTLELIGHLPGCVTMASENLGQNGITVNARYNDGTVRTFEKS